MTQSSKTRYVPLVAIAGDSALEAWLACAIQADGSRFLVRIERIPRAISDHPPVLRAAHQEARRAGALQHRSLAGARELFERKDGFYIASDFAPGETLGFLWRAFAAAGQPAPLALTARVIAEAAAALDFAHRQTSSTGAPLIHGHLSPESLVLGYDGKTRLTGHGTSIIHRGIGKARGGLAAGHPEYCAPELFKGGQANAQSDMFALGVILWELLTGKRLFARSTPYEVMRAVCDEPIAKPSSVERSVSSRLDPIIQRVLARDPAQRYRDYGEFLGALEFLLQLPGVSDQSMRLGPMLADRFPMRAAAWSEIGHAEQKADFKRAATLLSALQKPAAAAPAVATQPSQWADDAPSGDTSNPAQSADPVIPTGEEAARRQQQHESQVPDDATDGTAISSAEPASPSPPAPTPTGSYFDSLDWSEALNRLDQEDPDEDEAFVPPFGFEEILEPSRQPGVMREDHAGYHVMEIVRHTQGRALATHALKGLKRLYRKKEAPFSASLGPKSGKIKFRASAPGAPALRGWVQRKNDGDHRQPIVDWDQKIELKAGDQCEIQRGEIAWRIRVFQPPLPPARRQPQFTKKKLSAYAIAFGLALVLHMVALLGVLGIQAVGVKLTVKPDPEQVEAFAEGKLEDLKKPEKPEEPKPLPKPPAPTKPKPGPADPTEQAPQIPKTVKNALAKRVQKQTGKAADTAAKTEDVLKMLKSPNPGSGSSVGEVVSNIDAVKKPGGGADDFNVGGAIAALEGNEVNMALGGGGKLGKLGGSSTVGKDVGKLKKRKSSGKVRGKVTSIRALSKVSGSLSRSEVYKVIDRHMGKLQACYERRLADNPTLSGKVVFTWTVKTNGRVKGVRQRSSTLGDAKASKCLSGVIKKMKFPQPKGGAVEISYPFMFQQR